MCYECHWHILVSSAVTSPGHSHLNGYFNSLWLYSPAPTYSYAH